MSLFESKSLTRRGQNADIVFANIAGGASLLVPHNRQQGQPAGKLQLALVASVNSNTRNGKKRCQTRRSNSWVSPAREHRDDDLLVLGQAEVEGCHHIARSMASGSWGKSTS